MHKNFFLTIAAVVTVGSVSTAAYFMLRNGQELGILEASGQIRGTEVTVSSKIAGRLELLTAREGQPVSKGELIARIAAAELDAKLEQAKAEATVAESRFAEAQAGLQALDTTAEQARLSVGITQESTKHDTHRAGEAMQRAEAEVRAAEADAAQARTNYQRNKTLLDKGFISQGSFDQVKASLAISEAKVDAARKARAEAGAALERAGVGKDEVRLREKEIQRIGNERQRLEATRNGAAGEALATRARVKEIEALLEDSRLSAPSNGTVINRLAEPGELVAPGRPIVTLIDLTELYVRVFVAEKDIGQVRLGNPARITVDSFPGRFFSGHVSEIAQQAEFTPKEVHMKDEREKQVFGVKVKLDDSKGYLKPGMPADVRIKWQEAAKW